MLSIVKRFSLGVLGPAFSSAANLLLSLTILISLSSEVFGDFAFFVILTAFGFSIINALIGTPLSILINKEYKEQGSLLYFISGSLLLSVGLSIIIFLSIGKGSVNKEILLYSLASFFMLFRWSARTICHANSLPKNVMLSDFVYSLGIFITALFVYVTDSVTIDKVLMGIIFSSVLSQFFFGGKYIYWLKSGFYTFEPNKLYSSFKVYGRWSFVGVCSTEATTNMHSYIISIFFGAKAFAPIAAAALLYRPVSVVILSLTQMERPILSRLINANCTEKLASRYKNYKRMIQVSFVINLVAVMIFFGFYPTELLSEKYNYNEFILVSMFISIVIILRVLRSCVSGLIQASGELKLLSSVFIKSACIAFIFVPILTFHFGVIGSIYGIIVAELSACIFIYRLKTKIFGRYYD